MEVGLHAVLFNHHPVSCLCACSTSINDVVFFAATGLSWNIAACFMIALALAFAAFGLGVTGARIARGIGAGFVLLFALTVPDPFGVLP